ncbi:GCN5 family acetyltransferase [Mycobacterium sp. 852002-51163_SCH5372311]|uniref:N-acetylglutamate synthase, CG3035 family n=1 Tax=Mycobacterium sp. 852002-51163_SCH5372311 TaxID=1834097 RepID=UPI0007FE683B|nr:GCN5 family acetyltransferase [Mycobacterium sp. 852002-51163_SCH5372311]OBF92899.1 GCN5 family acetyltransferase [Mycobacterium sp. 852002-51163_SCH5372311]
MVLWPDLGTRVTVRYRRPAGSIPPLTDAVGHLLATDPLVRVRTKAGALVEFAPADAVALRVLPDTPVRTSQIRSLEHAAAAACPGVDHTWLGGWLLRAGRGAGVESNSAVPLDVSADNSAIPAIVDWYTRRGLPPRLLIPDRLLRPPVGLTTELAQQVLARDVGNLPVREPDATVSLAARPDGAWLDLQQQNTPVDVLTAVRDGEAMFATEPGVAAARAAVTDAPDGTRWVGLSAIGATGNQCADRVCVALLAWGSGRGATRGYLRVTGRNALAESLGFRLHHHSRYVRLPDSL